MLFFFQISVFPLLPLLLFILLLGLFRMLSLTPKTSKNTPPSPWKLPVIGNLHQLGSNPHLSLQAMTRKHGPLILIHLGNVPVLVASSAKAAQEILKTHDLVFSSRPKLSIPHKLFYGSKDVAFSPYGEYWRQVRSIAVLHLLSNRRVQSFRQVREEETARMLHTIEKSCGSVVDLSDLFGLLSNNIICRVAFGRTYRDRKFKELLGRFSDLLGVFSIQTYIPWLSWVDRLRGLEDRTDKVAKEVDEFLEKVIEEHTNKKNSTNVGDGYDKGKDFVDILLDVQRENTTGFAVHRDTIKAIILDMFAAGTDTTSTNIEWVISELIKHPQVMNRLQQEATEIAQGRSMITEDDLEKMQYLKAVVKESMRLHITLSLLIHRESTKDVKLMGYDVAKGTHVIVNAWAIGRDPTIWEEPDKFNPERFMNSCIDYKGFHFELLPFGAGRRGCPGIQFAVAVEELALANLVYKYNLALPNDGLLEKLDMDATFGLALHRKSPLLVVAKPRV